MKSELYLENTTPVILCGGIGSRLSGHTETLNKPLIKIGGVPILLHVAIRFWLAGFREIHIAAGWKFKQFESEFNKCLIELNNHKYFSEFIKNTLFIIHNTGEVADTFERVKFVSDVIKSEYYIITYGDTITDVDCNQLVNNFNNICSEKTIAMVSAVQPEKRFSTIEFDSQTMQTEHFSEKEGKENQWVGCGYIIISGQLISAHRSFKSLEKEVLPKIITDKQLFTNLHYGLWHPIDYVIDVKNAETMYQKQILMGSPSWLI